MALSDTLGVLRSLYPQARVTSGYRSPNSALGRQNPRSYHNVGQAFDVAPIQGVKFNDYVSNLKSHGVNVVEALDEASRPAFDTTGPNWHIAFGAPQVARKPKTLADMIAPPGMGQMPVGLDSSPMAQAPTSLADLSLPQGDIPQKKQSPFTAGNILGVLGDALMAYGGMQPQFGPSLTREREYDDQQRAEDRRSQFNSDLELQRQKALIGYKQANPDPPGPTEFEKLLLARGYEKGSPEYSKALDRYINYRESPDQYTNVPGYGLVRIPRGEPDVPTAPVGKLTPL